MIYKEILKDLEVDLLSRNLKSPNIRLNAIKKIDSYLKSLGNDDVILEYIIKTDKATLKNYLEKIKTYELNGAENSIVNEIYKRIKISS